MASEPLTLKLYLAPVKCSDKTSISDHFNGISFARSVVMSSAIIPAEA